VNITLDLKPLSYVDLPQLLNWRNSYAVWQWTRQNDLINEVNHREWFQKQATDDSIKMYGIHADMPDYNGLVGVCGLTSIDYRNSRAEFSLYIGPEFRGKKLGFEGLKLLFSHGFTNLGLNLIWGETFDGNPAIRAFERLGMVKEGTRRSFYWKNGTYIDAHLYSIKREEWNNAISNPATLDTEPSDSPILPD